MCGINAIFALGPRPVPISRDELVRTRDAMAVRGPDGFGEWISSDGMAGLGHRRLAIIDPTPRGAQPMQSHDGRFVITFNGEIYNHLRLRPELEAAGVRFKGDSDCETLIELYAREGERMLLRLRGMFAFCIWDRERREIFLARDPYGIKPLYVAQTADAFRVASQVKALLAGGCVSRAIDPAGLVGFLIRGTVPEPFTTHEGIRALPAGSWMRVSADGATQRGRYFSLAEIWKDGAEHARGISEAEARERVHEAIADSVNDHLLSDVPVGAFLSAGKDSSTMLALAAERNCDITAVTLRCEEFTGTKQDEAPMAARLAAQYGVRHVVKTLTGPEFVAELPRVLESMDQPSIDGWNSYFVSKAAAECGFKVMLSGTGGDELFGGYSTFRKIPHSVRWARPFAAVPGMARGFREVYSRVTPRGGRFSPKSASILEYCNTYEGAYVMKRGVFLPEELSAILPRALAEEGLRKLGIMQLVRDAITPDPGTPFARVAALEASFFLRDQLLRDIDWASMAHSVEVRVPLVDAELLRRLAAVACARRDYTKSLLADAPNRPLPNEVLHRAKTGFLLPIRQWMRPPAGSPHPFGMRSLALQLCEPLLA